MEPPEASALVQLQQFENFLAQGTIVEEKELLAGFISGIWLDPSHDRGVITWYDLPASSKFDRGRGTEVVITGPPRKPDDGSPLEDQLPESPFE